MENKEKKVETLEAEEQAKEQQIQQNLENQLKVVNAEDQTYEKVDSEEGFVQGEHDVEQMKSARFKEELYNRLLGSFDENGRYVISEEILNELVNLTKKIDAQTVNGTQMRAFVGDKIFYFNLTPPQVLPNGNAYVYLQLLEEIVHVNGYYINTQTTTVATYEYKNDDYFMQNACQALNIKEYDTSNENGFGETELMPEYMQQRYAIINAMLDEGGDALEKLEEVYFNKRFQILSKYPDLAVILAEFSAKRGKLEPYFMKTDQKYYYLNQILDQVMDMEICKKCLEKSQFKDLLVEADMKFYKMNLQAQEKLNENHKVNIAKNNMMVDLAKTNPAPKNPAVKINKSNEVVFVSQHKYGNGKYKKPDLPNIRSPKGGGTSAPKPAKKQETINPAIQKKSKNSNLVVGGAAITIGKSVAMKDGPTMSK